MSDPTSLKTATLHRIDPGRNMARYYTVSVEIALFDSWSCTRCFGRIGSRGGRVMIGLHESYEAAQSELRAILRRKTARGYRPVGP
ncbi:WGR domain-containing protein [Terrarubrum flagellatum]|uniref:WGR domain-containing protein n=1 Tax=Terrirubrum flagellatum TaxID=2895980 RepID=UPI0031451DBD